MKNEESGVVENGQTRRISLKEIFTTFFMIAFQSFGGAMAISIHYIVYVKKWMDEKEFLEVLTICQALPGPNVMNLSLVLGDRYGGLKGALVASMGMMLLPLIFALSCFLVYSEFSTLPAVKAAFTGMGASAAGLVLATAIRLAKDVFSNPIGKIAWFLGLGLTFSLVALMRVSMVIVLPLLGVPMVWWASMVLKKAREEA